MNDIHHGVPRPAAARRSRTRTPAVVAIVLVVVGVGALLGAVAVRSVGSLHPGRIVRQAAGQNGAGGDDAVAKRIGAAMAGHAPATVSSADARKLSEAVPAGATVDRAQNRIDFAGGDVHLVIVASPSWGKDMTFRIAGLTNPTISVPAGASVSVQFINADADMAHMWTLSGTGPPYGQAPVRGPAGVPGAMARPLGDASQSTYPSENVSFTAPSAGTYWYLCGLPTHAARGMYGQFVVQ